MTFFFFHHGVQPHQATSTGAEKCSANSRRVEKENIILTWKASEDFATRERCVYKQADNSFRDGFAHESREITDNVTS